MALLRSAATVGGYTLLSRVLGFVRDILIATFLGAGPVADVFIVAFRIPNLFRRLVAEGAFTAAFVPLFSRRLEDEGRRAALEFAGEALSILFTSLLVFTVLAEIAMPWLMYGLAPGFADDPQKYTLAVDLTRITFPYLLCMAVVALVSGMLNAVYRFVAAAAAPLLLNVFLIGVLLVFGEGENQTLGRALAWGVTAAGVAQVIWLLAAGAGAGLRVPARRPRLTPGVRRLLVLLAPALGQRVSMIDASTTRVIRWLAKPTTRGSDGNEGGDRGGGGALVGGRGLGRRGAVPGQAQPLPSSRQRRRRRDRRAPAPTLPRDLDGSTRRGNY